MKNQLPIGYQNIILLAALLCIGYVASLFLTYSFIVMPGLNTLDDRAFVASFQGLETRFQNTDNIPRFEPFNYGNIPALIAFPGAILFSLISGVINWKTTQFKWIIAAFTLFFIGMITTVVYNLPSNIQIFTAGDPNLIDVSKVRKDFNESAWLNWNHVRAATSTIAMFLLIKAYQIKIRPITKK